MKLPPTRLVLLGAPGSGKGTQGVILADRLGVPYLSSGELLRRHVAAGTELGRQAAAHLERGELVPDDLVLALVDDTIRGLNAGGYVLDGFPRTLAQARRLEALAPPAAAVHLALPDDVARRRLAGRAGEGRTDDANREVVERRLAPGEAMRALRFPGNAHGKRNDPEA